MIRLIGKRFILSNSKINRYFTNEKSPTTPGELHITSVLKKNFPGAIRIDVQDISGGCGAMFEIHVEDSVFADKRIVAQHRMVNEALKSEIKEIHGLRIMTTIPKKK